MCEIRKCKRSITDKHYNSEPMEKGLPEWAQSDKNCYQSFQVKNTTL
jgi:hypothetical protein